MANTPGLRNQPRARLALRVVGLLLLVGGIALGVAGAMAFAQGFEEVDSGVGPILQMGAGGLMAVFGLGLTGAGFLGAQSRYVAGETMPTMKDSASYLTDGEGVVGFGRTVDDHPTPPQAGSGPYCSRCRERRDADARFCDACGSAVG